MRPPDARGFSLVELLVALSVCLLLSGAIAAIVPPARAAFESAPEAMDLQQRERTVADVLARALRSAALVYAVGDDGTAGEVVPAVVLLEPDEDGARFHALRVLSAAGGGRGVLAADQAGPSGALRLRPDVDCPSVADVCGFAEGATAVVVDVVGRFNVFAIAATNQAAHSLSPSSGFAAAYRAGSAVIEVASDTYRLEPELDGSTTLVRQTAAGAVQPIVDNVPELTIVAWRPFERLKRVDLTARIGVKATGNRRQVPDRTLHLSIALRNPS
jgi:prepilin-type N-terminal cleavage/methylation domain-containing protein